MNETFPKIESQEGKIKKEKVLKMLKEKGFDAPETKELVLVWTIEQEALIEKENTAKASILFNVERTDLYLAIGDIDGALECLEDARAQAFYENETELYGEIVKKMNELEGGI